MKGKAKFTVRDAYIILTPRMVGDGAWRRACGVPVEDAIRKVVDVLAYLILKYPLVPHWLFVETVMEIVTEVVEVEDKETGEIIFEEEPISEGAAVKLIERARSIGLFEAKRPDGAKQNLLYFFTVDQREKLLRIRHEEALGYALSRKQAANPENPKAVRTPGDEVWYRDPVVELIQRFDAEWERVMKKLRKILHVIGLSVVLATGIGVATMAIATIFVTEVHAASDFSGITK